MARSLANTGHMRDLDVGLRFHWFPPTSGLPEVDAKSLVFTLFLKPFKKILSYVNLYLCKASPYVKIRASSLLFKIYKFTYISFNSYPWNTKLFRNSSSCVRQTG